LAIIVVSKKTKQVPFRDSEAIMITRLIKDLTPNKKIITDIAEFKHANMIGKNVEDR
jgi:hypothetical protein